MTDIIVLRDSSPVIADIDSVPGATGATGAPGPAGDIPGYANLAALVAAPTGANASALLKEAGRGGLFVFSTANLSAAVARDTAQGIYVAPASDTTGASGAWVRQDWFRGVNPEMFGATADGSADDAAAFTAMISALPNIGGTVELTKGPYKLNSRVTASKQIRWRGAGAGTRSYVYGETPSGDAWAGYTGTLIIVASNTAGLFFPLHTDVEDTDTVVANRGATGSNATYWEYPGASGSTVEGLTLFSLGGTTTTAHGIEARARIHCRYVVAIGFGGDGFKTTASVDTTSAPSVYGQASESTFECCRAESNRGNGFYTLGRDANVIKFDSCESVSNGGWGFDDDGFLGNLYINCHAALNNTLYASYPTRGASADVNVGSFRSTNTNAPHVYVNCYAEGGNGARYDLTEACQIFGGILSGVANGGTTYPYVQRGRTLTQGGLEYFNQNPTPDTVASFGGSTTTRVFAFGAGGNGEDLASGARHAELLFYPTQKVWSLEPPGVLANSLIQFPMNFTQSRQRALSFPKGFFLGHLDVGLGTTGRYISEVSSIPNGMYVQDDIFFKIGAAAGGKIGWVCTASGTKAAAWVSGTTYSYSPAPYGNAYVENAGNVYALHTPGGGTSTIGPTHGAGTPAAGADGYRWTFLNANTVPTFEEWGAIRSESPQIQSVTSAATVTPTFLNDQVNITAQAAALNLANPTGTAIPAWGIVIRIKDNGTARAITYGTQYRAIGVTLPTTTVISKTLYLAMEYNSTDTKWDVLAVAQEA